MNKSKVWLKLRESFWFMPAVYSIITLFLIVLISLTDTFIASLLKEETLKKLMIEKDTAKKIYSTLVTAILTMTTLSFSVIMVVLTTYASQFSPRILQNFMQSKFTRHVLGVYCSGFISALLLLFFVDHSQPLMGPVIMVVIALINLAAFVYFIHHSSRFLQVNNLIDLLKSEGSLAIKQLYEKKQPFLQYHHWDEQALRSIKSQKYQMIKSQASGYIQTINWKGLVNWAKKHDLVIELHVEPGNYVPKKYDIMTIWGTDDVESNLHSYFVVGNERSDVQDFEFTIEKLEEIALRAISPSTNDPHTAVNSMNRLGILLTELGACYEDTPYLADQEDQLRVIHRPISFDEYLYKTFYEIRNYGQNDVSVLYGILNVLYKIAVVSQPKIKQKVWHFHYYIMEVIKWDELSELDKNHLQDVYHRLKASCQQVES